MSRFQSVAAHATRSRNCAHFSRLRNPRRAGRESTSGNEFAITKKSFQHQELTHSMYPLLNQALRQEEYTQTKNRNCQLEGAHGRKATEVSTVHTAPYSVTRRPTHQRADRDDLRIRVLLRVEKKTIRHKHPGADTASTAGTPCAAVCSVCSHQQRWPPT